MIHSHCLLLICVLSMSLGAHAELLRLMSFNLRVDNGEVGNYSWSSRLPGVAQVVNDYRPAVMGTQEGKAHTLADLDEALGPNYERAGVERNRGGEFSAIYFDTSAVEKLSCSNFWMSDTPDDSKAGTTWGGMLRMTTTCTFRQRSSGIVFLVFNNHFDFASLESQTKSTALLWKRIQEMSPGLCTPVFALGDFNCFRSSNAYNFLVDPLSADLGNAWMSADKRIGTAKYSYHGNLGLENPLEEKASYTGQYFIDRILFKPRGLYVANAGVVTWKDSRGIYPSDHFPFIAEISLDLFGGDWFKDTPFMDEEFEEMLNFT
jgi:endonuclease/exonuclease/phosphatase family metal-dependent hydrolase